MQHARPPYGEPPAYDQHNMYPGSAPYGQHMQGGPAYGQHQGGPPPGGPPPLDQLMGGAAPMYSQGMGGGAPMYSQQGTEGVQSASLYGSTKPQLPRPVRASPSTAAIPGDT